MKTTIESDYEKQALDFLESTGTEFKCRYLRSCTYFPEDSKRKDLFTKSMKQDKPFMVFTGRPGLLLFSRLPGFFNKSKLKMKMNKICMDPISRRDYFIAHAPECPCMAIVVCEYYD